MDRIWALAAILALLPSAAAIGVTQDFMPDNYVALPLGGQTCHRVWLATEPAIEHGQVRLEVTSPLPEFVIANLSIGGLYDTINGSSDAIVFKLSSPKGAVIGGTYSVGFTVTGVEEPNEGRIPVTGSIGSGFTIKIVDPGFVTPDRCNQLGVSPVEPPKAQQQAAQELLAVKSAPAENSDVLALAVIGAAIVLVCIVLVKKKGWKNKGAGTKPAKATKGKTVEASGKTA